ncbi:MAG: VOC family protein [Haloplanus sp.]
MTDLTAHHFGVTLTDLDRAVEFYRDVFGLAVLDRFTVSGEAFARGVGVPDATGRFAHLDAGDARVELVEYDPEGRAVRAETVADAGAKHLGLAVDDLDAVYADLPETVETLSSPQTTESGTRICFVRDPDGNLVELLEA